MKKSMKPGSFICAAMLFFSLFHETNAANPVLKSGDSFYSFFWTQSSTDTSHMGYYGSTTIGNQNQGTTTTTDSAKFKLVQCPWWLGLVTGGNTAINFVLENSKPDSVDLCAGRFASVPWLHSINGSAGGTSYVARFFFPLLPIGQAYKLYDYFSIKVNDTMDLQFQGVADSVLAGSFVGNVAGKPTVLYAKNAIAVLTTSANALRLKSIQINGAYEKLVSSYLKFDLSKLVSAAAYYGLDMIDTIIPPLQVTRLSNGQGVFSIHQPIVDTFLITDDIQPVSIKLRAGAGDTNLTDISSNVTLGNSPSTYQVMIPANTADSCSGLRAFLVVTDGQSGDTINLSRAIQRDGTNCDDVTAQPMEWTPLVVTAQPNNPHLSAILSNSPSDSIPLAYDPKSRSIIQWLPQAEKTVDGGWVEYDAKQDSLFKITPGKLFWLADTGRQAINYGTAVVPSLIDTMVIQLNKNGWTDFSIPFRFNQYVGDIINASKKICRSAVDSSEIDSLEICQWIKSGRTYATNAVYLRDIPDTSVGSPTDTLSGGKAFSIFNRFARNLSLLIPPTSVATSSLTGDTGILKRRKVAAASGASPWSVKIGVFSRDTEFCSSMFCASVPSNNIPRFYPQSPSLSAIRVGVYDAPHDLTFGHAATGILSNGGTKFDLVFRNTGKASCPVTIKLQRTFGLPQGTMARLFAHSSSGPGIGSSDSLKTLLGPMQQGSAVVVVGTSDYLKSFSKLFNSRLSLKAQPFLKGLKIMYSLPYNTKTVKFTCINLQGRSILSRVEPVASYSGSFDWPGPIACGMYIVEMKAFVEGSAVAQVLRRKVMYVR